MHRQTLILSALLSVLGLVGACGGGGAGSNGTDTAPVISWQPSAQAVPVGQSATFQVTASGTGSLGFQWFKNGAAISGATLSSYTTAPTQLSDSGSVFRVVVSNTNGRTVTSNDATLSVTPGTFTAVGSMSEPRYLHTATSLPNGQVLVAGGVGLATAELFDPSTGTFNLTGSMGAARMLHTATPLPNGRVIMVGGQTVYPIATAEEYNPTTGGFTPLGSMTTERRSHTATLLPNGNILITGGYTLLAWPSASAELFDPSTGTSTLCLGSMAVGRSEHTATLLQNGKVLIAGGVANSGIAILGSEIYDPGTGTFTSTGALSVGRNKHTATLMPNGKVLILGGYVYDMFSGTQVAVSNAEVYDPNTGGFTPVTIPNKGPVTATQLPTGKVLITGGETPNTIMNNAGLFDPATGIFAITNNMIEGRNKHSAALLTNGRVLIIGGGNNAASAEIFQ